VTAASRPVSGRGKQTEVAGDRGEGTRERERERWGGGTRKS
jgi:hypothetical protein